jgi:hypothetical protein
VTARRDLLNQVIENMNRMKVDRGNQMLRSVLFLVRSSINDLLIVIIKMNFQPDEDWRTLKDRLDALHHNMHWMGMIPIPNLGALFNAVIHGISDPNLATTPWMDIEDRETHFRNILISIGSQLKQNHKTFQKALPDSVSQYIENIEEQLQAHTPRADEGVSTSSPGLKGDLEQIQTEIRNMKLLAAPLGAMLNLVQPVMIDILKSIAENKFDDQPTTGKLYRDIRNLQHISQVLCARADLEPLFEPICVGIQGTIPNESEWNTKSKEARKHIFYACLNRIGENIIRRIESIGINLNSIAPAIASVGRCLKNARPVG